MPDDKLDGNPMAGPAEPTGTVVPRWTGSAAIPPATPRRRWWQLQSPQQPPVHNRQDLGTRSAGPAAQLDPTRAEITRQQPPPLHPTTPLPDPAELAAALRNAGDAPGARPYSGDAPAAEERSYQDWAHTPAVDPWAEHDTSWQAMPGAPEQPPMVTDPPGGTLPPTLFGQSALPPTLFEPPAAGPGSASTGFGTGTDERNTGVQGPAAPSWRKRMFTRPSPATTPTGPPVPPGPRVGAPAGPKSPIPPKPSRRERKRRQRAGELPPPWSPPNPGPPQAPPRRRRKRRRALRLLVLLAIGAGLWYVGPSLGVPYLGQFPVTATLPYAHGDLELRTDDAAASATDNLAQGLQDVGISGDTFAGVYRDDNGKRVSLFGTTGFQWNPQAAVDSEMSRLTPEFHLRDIEPFDLGERGVHERCGVGRSDGTSVVVCSWADFGSVGSAVLTRRSASDSAELLGRLRTAVLTRTVNLS